MAGALSHLRVVELCDGLPVAYCGRQFATWGAEVVRVEPSRGSALRHMEPVVRTTRGSPLSLTWEYISANKQVALGDAEQPGFADELRGLLRGADVLITDWPRARIAAAGIDLADTARQMPRLVVLLFSDFGDGGPYAGFQATDLVLQALTAYMSVNGKPGRPPLKAPAHIVPYVCGVSAFVGTLAALHERTASRRGQVVEVAAMEAVAGLVQYTRTQYFGEPAQRRGGMGPPLLPCEDGYVFFDYLLAWARPALLLTLGIDADALPADPEAMRDVLVSHTRKWKAKDLFAALAEMGEVAGMVQEPGDLATDQHLRDRALFREVRREGIALPFAGAPARMSRTPASAPRRSRPFRGWSARAEIADKASTTQAASAPPLAGLRIVDLTQAWLGPYASMLLADLGADVIKIEALKQPDVWRQVAEWPPCGRSEAARWNAGYFFNSINRNKRDVALDLDHARGRELFLRLVRRADLVMENYTPRVLENFRLDYEQLRAVNPELLMVSFSGYGKSGPYREFKANGATIETIAGWDSLFGYADDPPMTMGEYQVDATVGLQMAACVLVALLSRDDTGRGQRIEGSMFEAAAGYIGEEIMLASTVPNAAVPKGNRTRGVAPQGAYLCAGDDRWIAVSVRDDDDWRALCGVVGEDSLQDEAYTSLPGRVSNADAIDDAITRWTSTRSAEDVMVSLQAAGVPAGVCQGTDEALIDPHLTARDWFWTLDHPDVGTHKYYGYPWSFSRTPLPPPRFRAPRLGEHSAEILRDELGLSDEEIGALVAAKVTGSVINRADVPRRAAPAGAT